MKGRKMKKETKEKEKFMCQICGNWFDEKRRDHRFDSTDQTCDQVCGSRILKETAFLDIEEKRAAKEKREIERKWKQEDDAWKKAEEQAEQDDEA